MYNIVIVDDSEFDLFRMKNFVESNSEYDQSMNIHDYSSGIDFLEEMKQLEMTYH